MSTRLPRRSDVVTADPAPGPTAPRRRARRRAGTLGLLGVAALVAAGCGSSASKSTAPPATTAPTSAATTAPTSAGTTASTTGTSAASPTTGPAATATTIIAKMTEFHIALSRTNLAPGTYTFDAVNAGHIVHALVIDGPGVTHQSTQGLVQPGQSANVTVVLQAGKYDIYCPVTGHKALGMDVELTVAGAATTSATTPASTSSSSGGGYGY